MLVLLPFLLFCSSWMLEKLGCTEISFKISTISPPFFVPSSRLHRLSVEPKRILTATCFICMHDWSRKAFTAQFHAQQDI